MSDADRILARLEQGPVSPTDFALPNVCDGGKPIMRVAARIKDLRDRNYTIRSSRAANGTSLYQLEAEPENSGAAAHTGNSPRVAYARRAPAVTASSAAAVTPSYGEADGSLGELFDGTEFRETTPHWRAA